MALNTAFSIYHIGLGITTYSWWLFTLGFYYLTLAIVRFAVLRSKKTTFFLQKLTGGMLLVLSLPLAGTVVLAVVRDRGLVLPQVVMIGMAAY